MLKKWEPIFLLCDQKLGVVHWSHCVMNLRILLNLLGQHGDHEHIRILGWGHVYLPFLFVWFLSGGLGRLLFLWRHFWRNHILAILKSDSPKSRCYVSGTEESYENSSGWLNLPLSLSPLNPRHHGGRIKGGEGKPREFRTVTVRLTSGTLVEGLCIVTFSTIIKHDPF